MSILGWTFVDEIVGYDSDYYYDYYDVGIIDYEGIECYEEEKDEYEWFGVCEGD